MSAKYTKWVWWILLFTATTLFAMVYSLSRGEMSIPISKIPGILLHGQGSMEYTILKSIRLPRIYLGLSVGGALSLAGVILQGIYRNPLVEPYTLGISGGAALGVSFTIVFGLHISMGSLILPVSGFLGAMVTLFLVYFLSIRHGRIVIQHMVLIGVMISFIASSAMMFLMSVTTSENLHGIVFWVMGSLDETNHSLILVSAVASVVSLPLVYLFIQPLNALRLGEEKARHLGVNTDVSVKVLFILASLLTGICVSIAGIIGFVGLIIPQAVRMVVGPDYRILLISSFLAGSSYLVLCDTMARTIIAPNELPLGVITGMIGGLAFIAILTRAVRKAKLNQ